MGVGAGRKIYAGTRHYAVLPLSFAVKPLQCAEGTRHDLLPCPDCQNDPKFFEIGGGKVHAKLTTNYYSVPQYLFSILHAFCATKVRVNIHRFPNCTSWSLDGSKNVCHHLVIKTCTTSSYLACHENCAELYKWKQAEKRKITEDEPAEHRDCDIQ